MHARRFGFISDQLSASFAQESLRYALLAVTAVVAGAGYCFFSAAQYFKQIEQKSALATMSQ